MNAEKRKLEEAACRYFLDVYNREQGTHFRIIKHGDRPDLTAQDGDKILGIEITHLYYGDREAMLLLGRLDKEVTEVEIFPTLAQNLNALLRNKAKQAQEYDTAYPMILVIRVASPVFNDENFVDLEDKIVMPENPFTEIWLLARDDETGSWIGLERLK